jgi:hypothetical protein
MAVQFTSLSADIVYVLVELGLTLKVYGLAAMPDTVVGVVPSVYVSVHGCEPVKATLSVVLPPLHIVALPLITLVGRGLTVTKALPVLSAPMAVQFTSLSADIVYVLVELGLTLKVYGLAAMPDTVVGVVPSVYVSVHGCEPVKATLSVVLPPLHIVALPLITLVGRGLTVTKAVAVPMVPMQVAPPVLDIAVNVYVFVDAGLTATV